MNSYSGKIPNMTPAIVIKIDAASRNGTANLWCSPSDECSYAEPESRDER
jgi:hypothetical protein